MTNAELAILSLVGEQPRHGYEIEQVIEERGMRAWTEVGFSSIYYLLKKLSQEGLVEGRLQEAERGPARKVYHITQAGQSRLREGLLQALTEPQRCYQSIQLGLANFFFITSEEAQSALGTYQDTLEKNLTQLKETWDSQKPLPYFVDALFDYSCTLIQAEAEWVARFREQIPLNNKDK